VGHYLDELAEHSPFLREKGPGGIETGAAGAAEPQRGSRRQ